MSEITLPVLWAVAQELFGALFLPLLAVALALAVLTVLGLVRGGARVWRLALGLGVALGLAVALLAPALTRSSLAEVATPTDYVLMVAIFVGVSAGVALLIAGGAGLLQGRRGAP